MLLPLLLVLPGALLVLLLLLLASLLRPVLCHVCQQLRVLLLMGGFLHRQQAAGFVRRKRCLQGTVSTNNAVYCSVGHARTVVHLYSRLKVAMCGFQKEGCLVCVTASCFHKAGNPFICDTSHWRSTVLLPPA